MVNIAHVKLKLSNVDCHGTFLRLIFQREPKSGLKHFAATYSYDTYENRIFGAC